MYIYARKRIYYDHTRVGYEDYSVEYSLESFDKNLHPSMGYYEYDEFYLPDELNNEDAKEIIELLKKSTKSSLEIINIKIMERLYPSINSVLKSFLIKLSTRAMVYILKMDDMISSLHIDDIKRNIDESNKSIAYKDGCNCFIITYSKFGLELYSSSLNKYREFFNGFKTTTSGSLFIHYDESFSENSIKYLIEKTFLDN